MQYNFYLFIDIRWFDVMDILLVAYLIYRLYYVVRGTAAINIFLGILSIYVIWKVVEAFQMQMLSEILGQFIGVGVIALIIVFQQELRKFLLMLGNRDFYKRNKGNIFKRFFKEEEEVLIDLMPIIKATEYLAANKIGGLIILARESNPTMFVVGGQYLGAVINSDLIISIFNKDSPLHDGAMIINNQQIEMAQCVLNVSESKNMPDGTGLRHRSALGIAEQTDAVAIVISEQTGSISLAHDGRLDYAISKTDFEVELNRLMNQSALKKPEML
jgi:uncharacterized protein (TIGR00159 family)